MDEIAFWRDTDSANPDVEIVNALRPGMATVPGALLIGLSSPFSRKGVLWDAYKRYYGKDTADVLVWQAATRDMNPTVPQSIIDRAYEEDPAAAAAEYGGEFRRDIEVFVTPETIELLCGNRPDAEPPSAGHAYAAFVDPSGGSEDAFTAAIGHREGKTVLVDRLVEVLPPFSPSIATETIARVLKTYGVAEVTGDHYAGEWPRDEFRKHGIKYRPSDTSKSDIYREVLPVLNNGLARLVDNRRLRVQLANLERRVTAVGREVIDHAPGAKDDLVNAALGVLFRLRTIERTRVTW